VYVLTPFSLVPLFVQEQFRFIEVPTIRLKERSPTLAGYLIMEKSSTRMSRGSLGKIIIVRIYQIMLEISAVQVDFVEDK